MERPTEPGIYQWHRIIVLLQKNGSVFNVLGCNDYLGKIDDPKFDDGWIQKLDVEYDP